MDSNSDEYDCDSKSTNPHLNMKHGFIYHIRRNQVARDDYDKKVKSAPRGHRRSQINKKPESKLYVPPKHDASNVDCETDDAIPCASNENDGRILFKMEYAANSGKIHTLIVRQGQDAHRLAKRLQNEAGIPRDLLATLEWKIKQEQIKRG